MTERLNPDERLLPDEMLVSGDGRFELVMQGDGNLVLYRHGAHALWATGTSGNQVAFAVMQGDGNFVLYAPDGTPVWASHTAGNPGAWLQIQDDGNLVIYAPGPRAIWASDTVQPPDPYMPTKEQSDDPVRAQGNVYRRQDDENYIFTVNVWTRVRGRGRTGRGHALFFMFGRGDEVISCLAARKYCSTDAIRNDREEHESEERSYRKAYYDANVISEMLVVFAEDKGGVPNTMGELVEWTKNVVAPELRNLRDQLTAGETAEGAYYFIRMLM